MNKQPRVIYVSDDRCQVSLNVGKRDGIEKNSEFIVYSTSETEITDPDTGESLGYLEFVKGTGKVTHLQEKMCTITTSKYKNPPATKTVRKNSSIWTALGGDIVEETVTDGDRTLVPFDNVEVGDYARLIN